MGLGSKFCPLPDKMSVTKIEYILNKNLTKALHLPGKMKNFWYFWVQTDYFTHLFASLYFSCVSVWLLHNTCHFFQTIHILTLVISFRPSIFCWSPVPSRVYQSTNQTLPSIPGINFGCYWKTTSVHCQGLSLISQM